MPKKQRLPDSSILETELARVADQNKIDAVRIIETADGFSVVVDVQARDADTMFLATRREPDTPRVFKDLERLNTMLRELYPDGPIELQCEQKFTAKKKVKAKIKPVVKKKRVNKQSKSRK
jgi:hypothetical protein